MIERIRFFYNFRLLQHTIITTYIVYVIHNTKNIYTRIMIHNMQLYTQLEYIYTIQKYIKFSSFLLLLCIYKQKREKIVQFSIYHSERL